MDSERLAALVGAARAGREEAYEQILATFGPRLYGYFARATGSASDAEDLVSEVMVRLVQRLADYDDRGRFEPWLFRIAANLLRDRIRRIRARPPAVSLEADGPAGGSLGETVAGEVPPVEAGLLAQEAWAELAAALARLDERSRQMVLLRYFGQLSFKEIAEIFQCPLGTVLAKVHRALAALRRAMEAGHEPDRA